MDDKELHDYLYSMSKKIAGSWQQGCAWLNRKGVKTTNSELQIISISSSSMN